MFIRIDGYAEAQIVKLYTSPLSPRPPFGIGREFFLQSVCQWPITGIPLSLISFAWFFSDPRERLAGTCNDDNLYRGAHSLIISIKHTRDARSNPTDEKEMKRTSCRAFFFFFFLLCAPSNIGLTDILFILSLLFSFSLAISRKQIKSRCASNNSVSISSGAVWPLICFETTRRLAHDIFVLLDLLRLPYSPNPPSNSKHFCCVCENSEADNYHPLHTARPIYTIQHTAIVFRSQEIIFW